MNDRKKADQLTKVAIYSAVFGLAIVLIIVFTPIKYPMLSFKVLSILGLGVVLVSFILYIYIWTTEMHTAYQKKQWGLLLLLVITGGFFIWQFLK